jgi:hypothetical protein
MALPGKASTYKPPTKHWLGDGACGVECIQSGAWAPPTVPMRHLALVRLFILKVDIGKAEHSIMVRGHDRKLYGQS